MFFCAPFLHNLTTGFVDSADQRATIHELWFYIIFFRLLIDRPVKVRTHGRLEQPFQRVYVFWLANASGRSLAALPRGDRTSLLGRDKKTGSGTLPAITCAVEREEHK